MPLNPNDVQSESQPVPSDSQPTPRPNGATNVVSIIAVATGHASGKGAAQAWPLRVLDRAHAVFRKWLGREYDLDVCDAVCAVAASERLSGDPVWLMLIGGPGSGKTEMVTATVGAGAHITSTITSEGALLSATRAKKTQLPGHGGLLRKIGKRGVLIIKDFTTILEMDRNARGTVLAALREIYDGRWVRNVGSEGGQTLEWHGRIVVIGAVTSAWDAAHGVIAAMGDRFVLLRINSHVGRIASGRQAIRNTGSEVEMREELMATVGDVINGAVIADHQLSDQEMNSLLSVADCVTLARTAVERDYKGEVINAHAPEMPTRFAKQLTEIVRGGVAIGMTREEAMRLALRCARDSIPPLRLEILVDVAHHPITPPAAVCKRINKPWLTVKRQLDAMMLLGMVETVSDANGHPGARLRRSFDGETLLALGAGRVLSPEK